MSNVSSEPDQTRSKAKPAASKLIVPWHPLGGVLFAIVVFYGSQVVAGLLLSFYPALRHWSDSQANNWLNNSVAAQFIFILISEGLTIWALLAFLRRYKSSPRVIGLKKPRLIEPFYGLAALPLYLILYLILIGVVTHFAPSLNVNQQQDIGFTNVQGAGQLIMTFISLVILPPLAEEIMVRGFLYSSLKKAMSIGPAVIITSLIFAAAHLPEGGSAGPLYIAALDTFVLSLVLIYLREKTGSLWASITLHALKNGIAFVSLFILHSR